MASTPFHTLNQSDGSNIPSDELKEQEIPLIQGADQFVPPEIAPDSPPKEAYKASTNSRLRESDYLSDVLEGTLRRRNSSDSDIGENVDLSHLPFRERIHVQLKMLRNKFFSPKSRVRRVWERLVFVFIFWAMLSIPFRAVFYVGTPFWFTLFAVVDIFGDIFFTLDFVSQFYTPYMHDGLMVKHPRKVRMHYLTGWFIVDLLSVVPVDYFYWGNYRVHTLLRMNRIIKFVRAPGYWSEWERHASKPALLRIFRLLVEVVILTHWIACGFYLIAETHGFPEEPWYYFSSEELSSSNTFQAFSMSLFWAFTTLIGLGSNPNPPSNAIQLWYTMLVVLVGVFVLAAIISNTLNLLANLNEAEENLRKTMDTINVFMFKRQVPTHIRKRIQLYYEYLMSKDGMDDEQILNGLPEHLRYDLSLYLNRDLIKKVPFFYNSEVGFIKKLAIHLKPQLYSPGEIIIKEGEIGDSMYFISRGKVEVLARTGRVLTVLKGGAFFGEIAILFKVTRTASVRAVKYTHVFVLKKEDLDSVLMDYPQYIPQIHEIAQTRLKELNIVASPVVLGKRYSPHEHKRDDRADLVWMKTFFAPSNVSQFSLIQLRYASEQLSHCLANVTAAIEVMGKGSTNNPPEPTHKDVT